MRLLIALVLVLAAGAAHAATLRLSAPKHLDAPRAAPASGSRTQPPPLHPALPASITFEARHVRHTRAQTSIVSGPIHVHDGDTFYVGPETFRLRGIDTPELGEPRAAAARDRLREILQSGPVTIVRRAEDVYGRVVADVFVDGRSVARILKAEGYAKPSAAHAARAAYVRR